MNSYTRMQHRLAGEPVDRPPNFDIFMTCAAHFIRQPLSAYYRDHRVLVEATDVSLERRQIDFRLLERIMRPTTAGAPTGVRPPRKARAARPRVAGRAGALCAANAVSGREDAVPAPPPVLSGDLASFVPRTVWRFIAIGSNDPLSTRAHLGVRLRRRSDATHLRSDRRISRRWTPVAHGPRPTLQGLSAALASCRRGRASRGRPLRNTEPAEPPQLVASGYPRIPKPASRRLARNDRAVGPVDFHPLMPRAHA